MSYSCRHQHGYFPACRHILASPRRRNCKPPSSNDSKCSVARQIFEAGSKSHNLIYREPPSQPLRVHRSTAEPDGLSDTQGHTVGLLLYCSLLLSSSSITRRQMPMLVSSASLLQLIGISDSETLKYPVLAGKLGSYTFACSISHSRLLHRQIAGDGTSKSWWAQLSLQINLSPAGDSTLALDRYFEFFQLEAYHYTFSSTTEDRCCELLATSCRHLISTHLEFEDKIITVAPRL
jgi:hypothetical protein